MVARLSVDTVETFVKRIVFFIFRSSNGHHTDPAHYSRVSENNFFLNKVLRKTRKIGNNAIFNRKHRYDGKHDCSPRHEKWPVHSSIPARHRPTDRPKAMGS